MKMNYFISAPVKSTWDSNAGHVTSLHKSHVVIISAQVFISLPPISRNFQ